MRDAVSVADSHVNEQLQITAIPAMLFFVLTHRKITACFYHIIQDVVALAASLLEYMEVASPKTHTLELKVRGGIIIVYSAN